MNLPTTIAKLGTSSSHKLRLLRQPTNPKTRTLTEAREKVPAPGILSREARTSGKKRLGGFIVTGMHAEERQRGALEGVLEVGISAAQLQQPPQLSQLLVPEIDDTTKSLQTSASGSCITQVLHSRLLLSSLPLAPQKTAVFPKKKTDGYEPCNFLPFLPLATRFPELMDNCDHKHPNGKSLT